MTAWTDVKSVLCIRPDNMGDLIMTGPALRALKQSFNCRITVLTSAAAAAVAKFIPEVDEVIIFDVPWVKNDESADIDTFNTTLTKLKDRNFDGAVIFTVYSQNPLPAAMLAYLAEIPLRLGYCRENPYNLLTHWIPDEEPFSVIRHQVERDLRLAGSIGAFTNDDRLALVADELLWPVIQQKLAMTGINNSRQWLILHAGVSEDKRRYPDACWIRLAKKLIEVYSLQVLFTGSAAEKAWIDKLERETSWGSFSVAGLFTVGELVTLISHTELLVSVNSGPVHIAAALQTPVVVLYAQSNPQHTPWRSPNRVLYYSIEKDMQSKNQVIRYVNQQLYSQHIGVPTVDEVISAITSLISI